MPWPEAGVVELRVMAPSEGFCSVDRAPIEGTERRLPEGGYGPSRESTV